MRRIYFLLFFMILVFSCTKDEAFITESDLPNVEVRGNGVWVCHKPDSKNPQAIFINESALNAHLAHGDIELDADGDNFTAVNGCGAGDQTDCDDEDHAVNPDAPEVCDGKDNDCDGESDEEEYCECPFEEISCSDPFIEKALSFNPCNEDWDILHFYDYRGNNEGCSGYPLLNFGIDFRKFISDVSGYSRLSIEYLDGVLDIHIREDENIPPRQHYTKVCWFSDDEDAFLRDIYELKNYMEEILTSLGLWDEDCLPASECWIPREEICD